MQANSQPIEKRVDNDGMTLDVHSIFYTIQGEGPFCGYPAVFIRLAGCNLQCPGCDTDYTSGRRVVEIHEIVEDVIFKHDVGPTKNRLVIITGGEPFRQNISPLVSNLHMAGFSVQIETNGTLPPPADLDPSTFIIVSPKTGKVNLFTEARAVAFKYVAKAEDLQADGLPATALDHTAVPMLYRTKANIPIYLQPMDEQNDDRNADNQAAVVKSCMENGFILQLQLHKIIGVE